VKRGGGAGTDTGVTGHEGRDTALGGAGLHAVVSGTGGVSAADAVASGVGGATAGRAFGPGGRQRARGARTPWYKSKLM